jgi:hypothetical protein
MQAFTHRHRHEEQRLADQEMRLLEVDTKCEHIKNQHARLMLENSQVEARIDATGTTVKGNLPNSK